MAENYNNQTREEEGEGGKEGARVMSSPSTCTKVGGLPQPSERVFVLVTMSVCV